MQRMQQALGRWVIDTGPLRESHDFRLLFIGQVVSSFGNQIRTVALPYQVYLLTQSPALVGLLSLAQFIPLMLFSLVGGALADMADRRRILLITQLGLVITAVALVLIAFNGYAAVWPLFLIAAVSSGIQAIDNPTRRAAISRVVRRDQLASALALNHMMSKLSQIVGPALGGVVIAIMGLGAAYSIDALAFLIVFAALLGVAPMPPQKAGQEGRHSGGLRRGFESIAEGFSYLKGKPVLISAFLIDLNATFFGMSKALFPALAADVFHVGPTGLGLLYASPAVGALVCAFWSGWLGRIRRQGQAVIAMVIIWGLGIAAFGLLSKFFWLALLMMAVAGGADMISAVLRNTILQLTVPDQLRGRLSAMQMMFTTGGPRLGDFRAGIVGQATSVEFSVVSGGLAAALGAAALYFRMPAFVRFDATKQPEDSFVK